MEGLRKNAYFSIEWISESIMPIDPLIAMLLLYI